MGHLCQCCQGSSLLLGVVLVVTIIKKLPARNFWISGVTGSRVCQV